MNVMRIVTPLAVAMLVGACSGTSAQQGLTLAPADVVATVGSTSITLAQVDQKALEMPTGNFGSVKLSQALYEARRTALEGIIDTLLLDQDAKRRSREPAALLQEEVTSKVKPPTDEDISGWYQANQPRLQGASLDQVREPIKAFLLRERTTAAREQYLGRLKAAATIHVKLEPPRQVVASAGHASKGPSNAPVELIEFSDFQCPYCLAANPTLLQVLNTYGDRIHFVYRLFPLPNHPNARPSAEAAQCADEQGKFWQFHDALFADQSKLSDADLKVHAATLGLDTGRFNACVDSHKYKDAVDADIKDGDQAGVSGTPAFFVNGRLLSGAQPYEAFKRMIDEEIALKKQP